MNLKKVTALGLAVVMTMTMAAGCGKESKTEEKGEGGKTVLKILRNTPQENEVAFSKEMVKEFEEKYPEIDVDLQYMAYDDYYSTLQTKLASGDAPDIFYAETAYLPKYVENEYLDDISDLDVLKKIPDESKGNLMQDGKVYLLGTDTNSCLATYNKDVFQKAGIEKVPETLEEFDAVCEKLKANGTAPIANGFKESWTISANLQADYVPGVLIKDENAIIDVCSGDTTFSDSKLWKEEFQRFFDRYQYSNDDPFGTTWNDACTDLATGKAGMIVGGSWAVINTIAFNEDVNLGVFPMPLSNNAEDTKVWVGSPTSGSCIYKDSKNKDAARKFLEFETSLEIQNKKQETIPGLSLIQGVEIKDCEAFTELQEMFENKEKAVYQGSIDHNFPNQPRKIFERLVSEALVNNDLDVDKLCQKLDEEFAQIQ